MKKFISILLISLLSITTFPNACLKNTDFTSFIVLDTKRTEPLPSRFRIIDSLNISGSAQFTPLETPNIKKTINKPNLTIVDLRQESHGFVNDVAISFYSPYKTLNDGFTTEETLVKEKSELDTIKINENLNIFNKQEILIETVNVKSVSTEEKDVFKNLISYKRFAVRDGGIPTPIVVDNFVEFVKTLPKDMHLHFHCDHGEGRTTTFMALYEIMKESNSKDLNDILKEQVTAGGIVLTDDTTRATFLNTFYEYAKSNTKNNFETSFSKWIKNNNGGI